MSKIWFKIDEKGIVFGKGVHTKFTLGEDHVKRPHKIYYVGEKEAAQITIGATIRHKNRCGQISSLPEYKKFVNDGFWYSDVVWDDGKKERFNLNKIGIETELLQS
jgi:hypothetical protein